MLEFERCKVNYCNREKNQFLYRIGRTYRPRKLNTRCVPFSRGSRQYKNQLILKFSKNEIISNDFRIFSSLIRHECKLFRNRTCTLHYILTQYRSPHKFGSTFPIYHFAQFDRIWWCYPIFLTYLMLIWLADAKATLSKACKQIIVTTRKCS